MSRFIHTVTHFRSIRLLGLAAFGVGLAGCASFQREPTYGLAPTDAAFVRQDCRQTMGLPPGLEEFDACAESLAGSLHERIDVRRVNDAHQACEQRGFAENTSGLAECMVLSRKSSSAPPRPVIAAASPPSPNMPELPVVSHISYFSMSNRVQDQHERLACAQLGLDPGTRGFHDCVIDIKQAIFAVQNPM